MEQKTKIILAVVAVGILVVLGAYSILYGLSGESNKDVQQPLMIFSQEIDTLTVTFVDEGEWYWDDWGIYQVDENDGLHPCNATLPSGTIDVDDVITNCSGRLTLVYESSGVRCFSWDFT